MKISIVQMNIKSGLCEENFNKMKYFIEKAKSENSDMIVFPQNCISGYYLGDKWKDDTWCKYVDSFNDKIKALSEGLAIVWGNVKYRHGKLFNCVMSVHEGENYTKVKVNENDRFMCDERYFTESKMESFLQVGYLSCSLNIKTVNNEQDLNICIDSRPYEKNKEMKALKNTLYVSNIGSQNVGKNVVVFDGQSYLDFDGKTYYFNNFEEEYKTFDLENMIENDKKEVKLLDALVSCIKHFDLNVLGGKTNWIVGLSGGLDSSITAALLVLALGNERVYGFNMATKYNSLTTKSNAQKEADALGIQIRNGSIEPIVDATVDVLTKDYGYDDKEWNSLVLENIQARLRGHLLASFASIHNGVIVNNGNKIEMALGYCTLYGDAIGAIAPIGDLTKVELFDLSHDINKTFGKEIVPEVLLPEIQGDDISWVMPPSAELKDNQLDPMKWFYHDYLVEEIMERSNIETFMENYMNDTFPENIKKWITYYHLDDPKEFIKDLDWFTNTMSRNGFKRLQTPPVISVSSKAFGNDYIEVQGKFDKKRYEELKLMILEKKN